jgi:putative nucleotidyltransferase with HDIG domain
MKDSLIFPLDILALVLTLSALLMLPRWRYIFTRNTQIFFTFILILFVFNHFSNTLEWLGITNMLDAAEDNIEILIPLFWGFAIYSCLQDHSFHELKAAYDSTLIGWTRALELKDKDTEGHSRRVTELSLEMAKALGLDKTQQANMYNGALLHDIGKMGVPDEILNKPGPLSKSEREIVEQHPVTAYEILKDIDYLRDSIDIPYYHHENWDGSGYPLGVQGYEIPIAARIFSIVDNWDALNSDRPYRKAWPRHKVIEYIRAEAGSKFDPELVDLFLSVILEDTSDLTNPSQ